jgi:hypothetical protein
MKRLWDNIEAIGAIVMALAAVIALVYAHVQITEGRNAERRANAHELWRESMRVAFDHPQFADPSLKLADFDYQAKTINGSAELFQKYEMYMDTILSASDDVLEVLPTKEWDKTLRLELRQHRDYLRSPHFQNSGYLEQYTPKFRAYLDDVLKAP